MLTAQSLTFRFAEHGSLLFESLDLSISPGRITLLQGESGSGKSTLCRILCAVIPHVIRGIIQGNVSLDGTPLQDMPLVSISQWIGVAFQNPDTQLFMPTVEHEIVFGLENQALSKPEMTEILNRILRDYGLEGIRHTDPRQCSGGEKQLIVFASVAAMNRPYLILDEAFSQVDPANCARIREQLGFYKQQGKGILVVDHRHVFDKLADEAYRLEAGRLQRID